MEAENQNNLDWLEFESAVFQHLQTHKHSRKNLDHLAAGKPMIPEPEGAEGLGSWLYRNVAMAPFEFLLYQARMKYEKQEENIKRQKQAEELLADSENRSRICFHLSQIPRDGLFLEEFEIKVIKAVTTVLYNEKSGAVDTSGTDTWVIARLVWELLNDADYCKE